MMANEPDERLRLGFAMVMSSHDLPVDLGRYFFATPCPIIVDNPEIRTISFFHQPD